MLSLIWELVTISAFVAELVLKRLGLEDLLTSEKKCLSEIAAVPIDNCSSDVFPFCKNVASNDTHIAQTQAILANLQRQNHDKCRFSEDEQSEEEKEVIGVKRKPRDDRQPLISKRIRYCTDVIPPSTTTCNKEDKNPYSKTTETRKNSIALNMHYSSERSNYSVIIENNSDQKNEPGDEIPSMVGSPLVSSTLKEDSAAKSKLSIFKYQRDESEEDDNIFDL